MSESLLRRPGPAAPGPGSGPDGSPGRAGPVWRRPWFIALAIVALAALMTVAAWRVTRPWRLDLGADNDTVPYYHSQSFHVRGPADFARALAEPFFRTPSSADVLAPEAKPVFVATLRLWGMAVRLATGDEGAWVTREHYFLFQLVAYALLAATVACLGWRLGYPYLGMAAALVSLLNPWAMVQVVYRNYTSIGCAMFLAAWLLTTRRSWRALLAAGVVAWMASLTDNAILLYAGVLGLTVVAWEGRNWRRGLLLGAAYGAGFAGGYVALWVVGLIWYPAQDPPLRVTLDYLARYADKHHFATRPPPEGRAEIPRYPGLALYVIRHVSLVVAGLLVACGAVAHWRVARAGVAAAARDPLLRPLAWLWAPVLLAWVAIDVKPGAQLAHLYFVGYPLVVLGLLLFWWHLARPSRLWRAVWGALAIAFLLETGSGLARFRVVFQSLRETVADRLDPGDPAQKIAMTFTDGHVRIIQHLLSPEFRDRVVVLDTFDDIGRLALGEPVPVYTLGGEDLFRVTKTRLGPGEKIAYILSGPETDTICFSPPRAPGPRELVREPLTLRSGALEVARFEKPALIPFYGTYPLLDFDDEWMTWQHITRLLDYESCTTGKGVILMNEVVYLADPPGR